MSALRQVLAANKIARKKAQLEELRKKDADFAQRREALNQRAEELKGAIDEVTDETPEEDQQAVEGMVAEHEANVAALDQEEQEHEEQKTALSDEIRDLEQEIEEINNRSQKSKEGQQERKGDSVPEQRKDAGLNMNIRDKVFGGMTMEQRAAFVAREDVHEFLERARELGREKRSVSGAELTIPDNMLELLRNNIDRYSKLIAHVNHKTIKGTARQTIAGAIPEGVWTEAVAKLNDLTFTFNQVEVDGYKVGGYVAIPNSTLEDSDIALATELLDGIGQAIGLGVDKAIAYGTGEKMPLGIATRLAQTVKPGGWGANAPTWTDLHTTNVQKLDLMTKTGEEFYAALIEALGVAKADYSDGQCVWIMNRKTHMNLMAKAINFNAAGALVAGMNGTMPVIGGTIVIEEFMADYDIMGGFGKVYLLAERAGANLATSEHAKFIEDQTVLRGTARYDGLPVFGEAFVLVNYNNTAPATTKTFASDTANP